jgi:hypothetical protein
MVVVNRSFHTRKSFTEYYPQFGHGVLETFASHGLGRKSLRNIGLNGRQIISQPRVPTYLGPALHEHVMDAAMNTFLFAKQDGPREPKMFYVTFDRDHLTQDRTGAVATRAS